MKSLIDRISERVAQALERVGVPGDPIVRESQNPQFGHFQSNCAMSAAKKAGKRPRELAAAIVKELDIEGVCEPPEIAGPGFINLRITPEYLSKCLGEIPPGDGSCEDRVGIDPHKSPVTVVVDMSSPNLAKELHVGHLRSTVIGDSVARILEFAGHNVIRENHVGDWGTQFGMLVAHLRRTRPEIAENPRDLVIKDLEAFYVEAKNRFDTDEDFKREARETVVALQQGDPKTRNIWRAFCDESMRHCNHIYDRLGFRAEYRGESYYNDEMRRVVARLEAQMQADPDGPIRISQGALCVFFDEKTLEPDGPPPLIARKSDGGFNYETSDLAAITHRVDTLGATRIIYVVGVEQVAHFKKVFPTVRRIGWIGPEIELVHLAFGNMLAPSGKKYSTRDGGADKLETLLDEAVARARRVVEGTNEGRSGDAAPMTEEEIDRIAEVVGLGAIKYFDLCHALTSHYKLDPDIMLSLDGNTAPYMMYAYARVRAIGRKAGVRFGDLPADAPIIVQHPSEIALALALLRFAAVVDTITRDLHPNVLTEYLYDLAKAFSRFYDRKVGVRVIDASSEATKLSRLKLCDLTARTLRVGLRMLGIETLEKM
ncbi:MAG: arginine--tRNA ligase [Planctomycetes bacterium]|nr:arginine--tRNA ligase [Planctomycetota bacterium]